MAETKSLFERDCEYRYVPGMVSELKYMEKYRNVSPDFLDRVLTASGITETDYYYLLGVYFYLMATARMVTDFMRYYRGYYGTAECSSLLMGPVSSRRENPLVGEAQMQEDEALVRNRLNRLAKKHLIFAFQITTENEDGEKREGSPNGFQGTVYCVSYEGFRIIKPKFGDWPVFERFAIKYDQYYCVTPVQKLMEILHACRVGVMAFMNHRPGVRIVREEEIIFGARKERYTPTMLVEVPSADCVYHVIVEPIHFAVDERILPKTKHLQNIENRIETMNRLINHYEYRKKNYEKKEEVRFLIAVENLKGMDMAVKMMNKYARNFSSRVFFTTDVVLKAVDSLTDGIVMAKEVKGKDTDEVHLGLVRPGRGTMADRNTWILENRDTVRQP